jgi:hypothetical protein
LVLSESKVLSGILAVMLKRFEIRMNLIRWGQASVSLKKVPEKHFWKDIVLRQV